MGKLWVALIFITMLALIGWALDPATLSTSQAQPPALIEIPAPGIAPVENESMGLEATPAEEVTQSFYDWYVAALEDGGQNPLDDGSYRASPDLSRELVRELDGIVVSFGDGPRYDPVLFAATIPQIVSVRSESATADEALVLVRESWKDTFQDIMVRLHLVDGQWKLVGITRPVIDTTYDSTPQHAVQVFYNWYTEYFRRVGNPLFDRAYQGAALSRALLDRLEAARTSASKWPADDPVLLGQTLTAGFDVALDDTDGQTATVWVRPTDDSTTSVDDAQSLWISLQKADGRWVITAIAHKPSA